MRPLASALDAGPAVWQAEADAAIVYLAGTREPFTVDDVASLIARRPLVDLAGRLQLAQRRGVIVPVPGIGRAGGELGATWCGAA